MADEKGHAFSVAENRAFWDGNAASYQGEKNAEPIVFLTREFIGKKVLDAGAGEGSLVRAVRSSVPGVECIGVDIAPKSEDVLQGDLTNIAYDDGNFDTVFCSEVIEHCTREDTTKIVSEIARVLSPGGHLILTTPFDEKLEESVVTCPCCNRSFHRWGHQQRFVEDDFRRLGEAAGLDPLAAFPVKYSRVRRLRFLGAGFCRGTWLTSRMRRAGGHRTLFMIASKKAG